MAASENLQYLGNRSCVKGLRILERLCAAGQWVPAWIIRDHLRTMLPLQGAWASFVGRMMHMDNACQILEEAEFNLSVADHMGNTLLHYAAGSKTIFQAKSLINLERSLVEKKNRFKETPLHVAAQVGDTEVFRLLLEAGCDIDAVTRKGQTALHICAKNGNTECLHILIGRFGLKKKYPFGEMMLHVGIRYNLPRFVEYLLSEGVDVNVSTNEGLTPLHLAVMHKGTEIALMLIKAGASMERRLMGFATPLGLAAAFADKERLEILTMLVDAGAPVNESTMWGETALHIAVRNKNPAAMKILVHAGAKRDALDMWGLTPLKLAQFSRSTEYLTILRRMK